MKGRVVLFGVVLAVGAALLISGCGKKSPNEPKAERLWTIMGYFDGNNDLDVSQAGTSFIIGDVHDMEKVGSTDQVSVVVMVSSLKTGGNATYYEIEKHEDELPDKISSTKKKDLGTKDMSDPQTLKDFIKWAVDNYPAKHYMLIIDDHGGGWRGTCVDTQNGAGDFMSMPELRQALNDAPHLDVIVFHACLMSMVEVAYELKDAADYMVASEFTMPVRGVLGADVWLNELSSNPKMTAYDIAEKIAQAVYDKGVGAQRSVHMAVIDLSQARTLGSRVSNLGNTLVTETRGYWSEVLHAWSQTHVTNLDDPSFVDLREFVKKLIQEEHLKDINLIKDAAQQVIDAVNSTVKFTKTNAAGVPRGGLTIHFPSKKADFDSSNYVKLAFKETNWHNFLSLFLRSIQQVVGNTVISGTVTWPNHQLSQNAVAILDDSQTEQIHVYAATQVDPNNGQFAFHLNLQNPIQVYVEAFDDINGDGQIQSGEGYGWWDKDGNGQWDDLITVKPGDQLTNIQIQLQQAGKIRRFANR